MDAPEPDQTPFAAVTAQTSKIQRSYQALLDQSTPYVTYRWIGSGVLLLMFFARILVAQGWYIGSCTHPPSASFACTIDTRESDADLIKIVAYALGIYLLNLFLAFLQPKFDPSNEALDNEMEDGSVGSLPTKSDEEFRPFIRRLPEFKFWHSATTVIAIAFFCSWFEIFNVPVFWPVLVMYWFILFFLTSKYHVEFPCIRLRR